jgi:hypothetical protein
LSQLQGGVVVALLGPAAGNNFAYLPRFLIFFLPCVLLKYAAAEKKIKNRGKSAKSAFFCRYPMAAPLISGAFVFCFFVLIYILYAKI